MRRLNALPLALALALLCISPTYGAAVNFSLSGSVFFAAPSNAFGLDEGDAVTVSGTFDDVRSGTGFEFISFSSGSGNSFTLQAGNRTYRESDDLAYAGGTYPRMQFSNGILRFIDFVGGGSPLFYASAAEGLGCATCFSDTPNVFDAEHIVGEWDVQSFTTTPVPEPAAALLMLAGMGIVGTAIRRRRR